MQATLVASDYDANKRRWTLELISADGKSVGKTSLEPLFSLELEEELKWYLQEFALRDPLSKRRADAIRKELNSYGKRLAATLEPLLLEAYGNPDAGASAFEVSLTIKDDDSAVSLHSFHWELLEQDSIWQTPSLSITVSRQFSARSEPMVVGSDLSRPLTILFVSARPDGDSDRPYRLISQPIYDLISRSVSSSKQVRIDFVRPGTWKNFEAVLKNPTKKYSIIHFDTHGILKEQQAGLVFSTGGDWTRSNGVGTGEVRSTFIEAEKIGKLLVASGVKVVVLNACDTAKQMSRGSNLAACFARCGVPNIVAMSFALMSYTAPRFMIPFYQSFLIDGTDLRTSVSIARHALQKSPSRQSRYSDEVDVFDYFVPVLYQNHGSTIKITGTENAEPIEQLGNVQKEVTVEEARRGGRDLLGRDSYLLYLEILFESWDAVLINAPPGLGKTAMVEHFADWWIRSKYFKNYYRWTFTDVGSSGDECPVLKKLLEFQAKAAIPAEKSELVNYNFSGLVVVDEVPSFDHMSVVEKATYQEILRVLSSSSKSRTVKLVLLTRNWVQESGDPSLKVIRLGPLMLEDALKHAQDIINDLKSAAGDQRTSMGSTGKDLERLLGFHACDLHFINIFCPLLARDSLSPSQLLQDLQLGLPKVAVDRMNILQRKVLTSSSPQISPMDGEMASQSFLSYFDRLVVELRQGPGLAYWCLLSIASFQKLLPVFMRSTFAGQIETLIMPLTGAVLPSAEVNVEAGVERVTADVEAILSPKTKLLLSEFDRMATTLKSWGMAQDVAFADVLDAPKYLSLHTCLPYLIRHHIMSDAACKKMDLPVRDLFWTVYELQRKSPSSQSAITSILIKDGINVRNALSLTLEHPSFGLKQIALFSSFFPPYMELEGNENAEWLNLLTKAVERFEVLAGKQRGPEAPRELGFQQDLLCWALLIVWFRGQLMQYLDIKDEEINQNASRGLRLAEPLADNAGVFAQSPSAEACKIMLRIHILMFKPAEERTMPEYLAEVKRVLETDISSGVRPSFPVASFYGAKVALVSSLGNLDPAANATGVFADLKRLAPQVIQVAIDHIEAEPAMDGYVGTVKPALEKLRDRAELSVSNTGSSLPEDDKLIYRILKPASFWPSVKLDLSFLKYRGGFPSLSGHAKIPDSQKRRQLGTFADKAKKTGDIEQEIRCRVALFELGMTHDDYELCTSCYSRLEHLGALPNEKSVSDRTPVFPPLRQGRIQRLLGCMLQQQTLTDRDEQPEQQQTSSTASKQMQERVRRHFDTSLRILEQLDPSEELALTLLALSHWEAENGDEVAAESFKQRIAAMEYGEPSITMDFQRGGRWVLDATWKYGFRMLDKKRESFETDPDPNKLFWMDCVRSLPAKIPDPIVNPDAPALFEEAQYVYLSPHARSGERELRFWTWNDGQGCWRLQTNNFGMT